MIALVVAALFAVDFGHVGRPHTRMAALNQRRLINLGLAASSSGWAIS